MRHASLSILLGLTATLAAVQDDPHPAELIMQGGDTTPGYVIAVTVEDVEYSRDERGDQRAKLSWSRIADIRFEQVKDPNYYSAISAFNQGKWEAAAELFGKMVDSATTQHERITAFRHQVEALAQAGKAAEAVAVASAMQELYPRHPELLGIKVVAIDALLAAGEFDAARAAYQALADLDLGPMQPEAEARSVAGIARVLVAQGDHAGAAAAVEQALARLDRADQADAWASLGIVGVRAKLEAGDEAGAATLAEQVRYLGSDPAIHAEAHLVLARSKEASDKVVAFDHAVIAALRAGADHPDLYAQAARLARSLAEDLSADESLPEDERLAYKTYARSL